MPSIDCFLTGCCALSLIAFLPLQVRRDPFVRHSILGGALRLQPRTPQVESRKQSLMREGARRGTLLYHSTPTGERTNPSPGPLTPVRMAKLTWKC